MKAGRFFTLFIIRRTLTSYFLHESWEIPSAFFERTKLFGLSQGGANLIIAINYFACFEIFLITRK